jgi:DNA-binding NarL/FixJ family response regulator
MATVDGDAGVAVSLTPRQREVLQLVADGLSTRRIAEQLWLSPATVRNHVRAVLVGLGAHTRLEAVATAHRLGLLRERPPGAPPPLLTTRQNEVLVLLVAGLSTRSMAGRLGLSPSTVRNHVASLTGVLGVHSRLEAVATARRAGVIASQA